MALPLDDFHQPFASIPEALAQFAKGRPVVVVDDPDRENEGDIIFAASLATPETVAMCVRYTSGVLCTALDADTCDRLQLPQMVQRSTEAMGTAYTVSVDAAHGITTGISAADRAKTIRLLADPSTQPDDLARPGHVFPLRARSGGVLSRTGHTEAAVDLCRLAGLPLAGVLAEVVRDDGDMARLPDLIEFAAEHGLCLITIADLVEYRRLTEPLVSRVASSRMPTRHGLFTAHAYCEMHSDNQHLALTMGDVSDGAPVLTRVHSECLTGDALGSLRCDCGPQLDRALTEIAEEGRGVLVYLRGHEGRCIGLAQKVRAYGLQDEGCDTVEANVRLGLPVDTRDYADGAHILHDLGVRSVRLLTNNPAKSRGLRMHGVDVAERVPLIIRPTEDNVRYLQTKQDKMGHQLGLTAHQLIH